MSHYCQVFLLAGFVMFSSFSPEKSVRLYIFMEESCKICQYYSPELIKLYEHYGDQVEFIGLFPNPGSNGVSMEKYRNDFRIPFKLEKDLGQLLTGKFGATITPEVFLVDIKKDKVLYSGRIDNSYVRVGKRRTVITSHDLQNALEELSKTGRVTQESKPSVGCFIMRPKANQ